MNSGRAILFARAVVRGTELRILDAVVAKRLLLGKMGRGWVGGAMGLRVPGWRTAGRWCAFLGLGCQRGGREALFILAAAAAAVSVGGCAAAACCWGKGG